MFKTFINAFKVKELRQKLLYPGAGVAGHPLPAADEQRRRAGH